MAIEIRHKDSLELLLQSKIFNGELINNKIVTFVKIKQFGSRKAEQKYEQTI